MSGRLVKLLEQYRDRLHYMGDDDHDEELDYMRQILGSPIFQQYLTGESSHEDTTTISKVSSEVISGIEVANEENGQLSPTEKQKRKLARKRSLRALRNAVTPQNSPVVKSKWPHSGSATATASMAAGDTVDSTPSAAQSKIAKNKASSVKVGLLESRTASHKEPPKKLIHPTSYQDGMKPHLYGTEPQALKLSNGMECGPVARNLSNSTNNLFEQPPGEHQQGRRNRGNGPSVLSNGISGSQPNVYKLGVTHGPAIGIPAQELELHQDHFLHPGLSSTLGGPLEWNQHTHHHYNDQHAINRNRLPLELEPPSQLHHQPPPYIPQLRQNEPIDTPRRPPPPYSHPLLPQRKAKSFDKLLDAPDSPLLQIHPPPPLRPLVHPMTDGSVTQDLPTAQSRKTQIIIRLEKGEEGLGFRVKGLKNEQKGGIYVQDMLPRGLAERDGRLRRNDQILSINGHSLQGLPHNEAVKLLQSARGMVELVIRRDLQPLPPSSPSPSTQHPSSRPNWQPLRPLVPEPPLSPQEITADLTTPSLPQQQKIQTIELPNEGLGFGFGVIPGQRDRDTVIHSFVSGGIAEKDGRLRQGDLLLQINEESIIHMRYEEVVAKLRSVSMAGRPIRLVVSRAVSEDEAGTAPEINDSSDEEVEEFEVELHKQNRGLGITIAGLVKDDTGEEVKGIFITSLNPVGAAAEDGRIQVGDRINKVDGHPLRGLENMEAAAVLRNSGNPVKLVLSRRRERGKEAPSPMPVIPADSQSSPEPPPASEVQSHDQPHDQLSSPGDQETLEGVGVENPGVLILVEGERVEEGALPTAEEEQKLIEKWSSILGHEYIVKVAKVTKSSPQSGLGIRMESTAELDDSGNPQAGSIHHVVQYVHVDGPMGQEGVLQEGDEILEVNGTVLVGQPHDHAIEVVKNTPTNVVMVVCSLVTAEERAESHFTGSETTESEDDKQRNSTPDMVHALPSINFSELGDFTRRFERQSWRERHEVERRRLKQRFEQQREEYERHIREQEEELLQQEEELKERQRRTAEEEERRKANEEQKRNSTLLQAAEFDYSPYTTTHLNFMFPRHFQSPDSARDSFGTDSSISALSPVPGSGLWEPEITEIDLQKGPEGLGFSILDFADPFHPGDRVILVHSLVEGGVAEMDGRLNIGDKLVSVNGVSVVNYSLQFAVQQLVSVPQGGVAKIGVNHPLPASPEIDSSPSSPLSANFHQFFTETQEHRDGSDLDHSALHNIPGIDFEMDEKPLSDEVEGGSGRVEVGEGEDDDSTHLKKKKASDSEDDEPPPPYSKTDPQEEKFEHPLPLSSDHTTTDERKLTTESANASRDSSTANLSRIISPTRGGRTLSDLTRITPEDEARLQENREHPPELSQVESLSDSTLVNSGSQSEVGHSFSSSVEVTGSNFDQPKLVLESSGKEDWRRRERRGGEQARLLEAEKQAATLTVNYSQSQGTVGSSQDSNVDGLSPDMSDYDHSNEAEPEPREIKIRKGNSSLGMYLTSDYKSGSVVVKNVVSNGAVGRDGRIRVGDRILAINGKPLEGVSLSKAKSILKRASSKSEHVRVTYIPAPHLHGYSISYGKPVRGGSSHSLASGGHHSQLLQPPIPVTPLHNIMEQEPPQGPMPGAQANIQMAPHHVLSSTSMTPQHIQILHQTAPSPQWQPNVSPYVPPGATSIAPLAPGMSMQSSYLEQATAIGKLPPPYGYLHPASMMAPAPSQPYPQPVPQPTPLTWGLQQQPPVPMPPPTQHAPMQWVSVIHREPPQYNELMAQQQMIPSPQYQMAPSLTQHQMQSPQMSKSQSETKFHSGMVSRPPVERRHTSHRTPHRSQRGYLPVYQPIRSRGANRQMEEPYEPFDGYGDQQPWSHDQPPVSMPEGVRSHDGDGGRSRFVEIVRDHTGSLGINVGQLGEEGSMSGIFVKSMSPNCQAIMKGKLNPGDQILEVNGINVRHFTQAEAVNILKNASSPVRVLVQSLHGDRERLRPTKFPRSAVIKVQESPEHSHHNSWAIDEEEDPLLREEFPSIEGHLFEVVLNRGKSRLGLNIVANTQGSLLPGIVIMRVQPGGVADRSGRIKWGDMILKVNETCVIGMSQEQVQELLAKAPPIVRFVLVRQHMNVDGAGPQKQPSSGLEKHHAPGDSEISLEGLAQAKAISLWRDDEKGLGFTVGEGEQGDKSIVVVKTIIPGGPADQDGELQVGDQIISVDGQKILGYPYEKGRHLLQTARARGSVSLVVASRSAVQHEGGQKGVQKAVGRQVEGVVLRSKKRGSSLKSSRRRPVSVDYDTTVIKAFSGTSQEGGARHSHYGNRNSHPLTEREVEIGFQNLEKQRDILPGKESDVVIFRGSQLPGVIVMGGANTLLNGIYVQKILPESPADKDGRLQPGDRILKVNNISLENASCKEAIQALQHPSPFTHIVIVRDPTSPTLGPLTNDPPSPGGEIELVELMKPERGGLGLYIAEYEDQPGVYVQNVVENDVAYHQGRVRHGDKILAINGQEMLNARQSTVVHALQSCRGRVILTVQHLPPPSSQINFGQPEIDQSPQAFNNWPLPHYPYNTTSYPNHRDPPPYSSTSTSLPPPPGPTQVTHPLPPTPSVYLASHHAPPQGVYRDVRPPSPVRKEKTGREKIKVIRLHRGPSGLGFTIVGGKGSPQGDLPIFIKRVCDSGAAGRDGRLRKGDQLLAVNGISFECVTHQHAAETLLQGDVELTVLSTD